MPFALSTNHPNRVDRHTPFVSGNILLAHNLRSPIAGSPSAFNVVPHFQAKDTMPVGSPGLGSEGAPAERSVIADTAGSTVVEDEARANSEGVVASVTPTVSPLPIIHGADAIEDARPESPHIGSSDSAMSPVGDDSTGNTTPVESADRIIDDILKMDLDDDVVRSLLSPPHLRTIGLPDLSDHFFDDGVVSPLATLMEPLSPIFDEVDEIHTIPWDVEYSFIRQPVSHNDFKSLAVRPDNHSLLFESLWGDEGF